MSNFFESLFNQNNNSCNCSDGESHHSFDIKTNQVDVELADPTEILLSYYDLLMESKNAEEVAVYISMLFYEGVDYGTKRTLISDLERKIEELSEYEDEVDDDYF